MCIEFVDETTYMHCGHTVMYDYDFMRCTIGETSSPPCPQLLKYPGKKTELDDHCVSCDMLTPQERSESLVNIMLTDQLENLGFEKSLDDQIKDLSLAEKEPAEEEKK